MLRIDNKKGGDNIKKGNHVLNSISKSLNTHTHLRRHIILIRVLNKKKKNTTHSREQTDIIIPIKG